MPFLEFDLWHLAQYLILATLVFFAFLDDWWMLLALIVLRPITDAFGSTVLLTIGPLAFNLSALVGLVALGWGIEVLVLARKVSWPRNVVVAFLAFAVLSVASIGWSVNQTESISQFLRFLSTFVLFIAAMIVLQQQPRKDALYQAIGASLLVPCAVAAWQLVTGHGLSYGDFTNRIFGTFGHPNVFALYLVVAIVALFWRWMGTGRRMEAFDGVMFGTLGVFLLLTYTRGSWLALLVSFAIIGFVRYRKIFARASIIGLLLLILAPAAMVVSSAVFDYDLQQTQLVKRLTTTESEDDSLQWRIDLWKDMRTEFFRRPLIGAGFGTFTVLNERRENLLFRGLDAHNDYVRLIIELGVVGVVLYLIMFGTVLQELKRQQKTAMLALTVGIMTVSFFDNVLQGTAVLWLYWVLVAAAVQKEKRAP